MTGSTVREGRVRCCEPSGVSGSSSSHGFGPVWVLGSRVGAGTVCSELSGGGVFRIVGGWC